jgi:hypothetical protein
MIENTDKPLFSYRGIKNGDSVKLHFAGGPNEMPLPWIVVDMRERFSTVNYKYNPVITVKASNGNIMTFERAEWYSPEKVEK